MRNGYRFVPAHFAIVPTGQKAHQLLGLKEMPRNTPATVVTVRNVTKNPPICTGSGQSWKMRTEKTVIINPIMNSRNGRLRMNRGTAFPLLILLRH